MNDNRKNSETPEQIEYTQFPEEITKKADKAMQILTKQVNLEESAYYSGALLRRRVIQSAWNLLRLVMTYSLTDYSLRMLGLWGTVMGWGSLSKSGVRKRLRQCQSWIGMLIVNLLLAGKLSMPRFAGVRLRVIDASNVNQPGSQQPNWRLHLSFDLTAARIDDVQLTPAKEGETLTRWQFQADEICLADRYYGVPRSLGVLLGAMAHFVIRIGWQNLPLQDQKGSPFSIGDWLKVQSNDPAVTPAQTLVWVSTPQGRFPVRLIARAIPPDKAEKIRRRLQAEAQSKKRRLDERTLLAAGFVMVVTNLPDNVWSASQVLALYRFRWQVELVFKRLKGILSFDHLRATDPCLAQVYLLTKILIALVLEDFQWRIALANEETSIDTDHPVSPWRFTQLVYEAFRNAVCGCLTWELIDQHWTQLQRYLRDDPRRRKQQFFHRPNMEWI